MKTETGESCTSRLKKILEYKHLKLYEDKSNNNKNCVSVWSVIKKNTWNVHKKF